MLNSMALSKLFVSVLKNIKFLNNLKQICLVLNIFYENFNMLGQDFKLGGISLSENLQHSSV